MSCEHEKRNSKFPSKLNSNPVLESAISIKILHNLASKLCCRFIYIWWTLKHNKYLP